MAAFQKGNKLGGRTHGSKNKVTQELREMILSALDKAGGVEYLLAQAKENSSAFLTLIGKVLPTTVSGPNDGAIQHRVVVELVKPQSTDA